MLRFRGHGVSTEDATILRGMGRLASERGPWRSGWVELVLPFAHSASITTLRI